MIKLKNLMSEHKWGNTEITLGKVYTHKDAPPFKTEAQIEEDRKNSYRYSVKRVKVQKHPAGDLSVSMSGATNISSAAGFRVETNEQLDTLIKQLVKFRGKLPR